MNHETLNRKLAKVMNVHWHEFKDADGDSDYLCLHCGELQHGRNTKPNPDYLNDISACLELVEWMRKEKGFEFECSASAHKVYKNWIAQFDMVDPDNDAYTEGPYESHHASLPTAISLAAAAALEV